VMAERIIEIDEEGNVSIPLDPQDEITQLKADLAKAKTMSDAKSHMVIMMGEDIVKFKADLARFGGHTADCLAAFAHKPPKKCDCGFAEAQERWE